MGREGELTALVELLDVSRDGAGGVGFIEGEAGIGKSRLLAELRDVARQRGFQVLLGAAEEVEAERPFGAWVEALGLDPGSDDPERAELGRLVAGHDAEAPSPAGGAPHADLRFQIVEWVLGLIERLATGGPLFVALEDLQWADPSTLRVLRLLGREVAQLPLVVVATRRSYPSTRELERTVDGLASSGARVVSLDALGPNDMAALADIVAGFSLGSGLSGQLASTGGNPLFVIELVSASVEGLSKLATPAAPVEAPMPATLRLTIQRRVASLPPTTVEALKVAAVLGRRFSLHHLSAVMGRSPVALVSALEDALAARVLGEEDGELVFRHELIRDAVYAELALPLRRGVHREAARVLSSIGAAPGQVAEHLLAGAGPGDREAIELLARASRTTAPRSPQTAVRLLEGAMALVEPGDPRADALAAELAPLLIQAGRASEAERLTRHVLARRPDPAVAGALRRALGEVLWSQGWLEPAVTELEAAAQVEELTERERSGAQALAANLRLFLGEAEGAEQEAARAQADGERLGDDFTLCLGLQTLAVAADAGARVSEAVALAERAVAIAGRMSDPRVGQLYPHLFLGLVLLDADRLVDAEAAFQEGRRRAEQRGAVAWLSLYHCVLAMRRVLSGSWDDALAEIEAGMSLADEVGTRLYVPFLQGMAAYVALQRGELGVAQAHLEDAFREFVVTLSASWQANAAQGLRSAGARWPLEWGLWIGGLLHEANGNDGEALRMLDDAWSMGAPLRYFLGYRLVAPDLIRLAMRTGRHDLATVVAGVVEEGARRAGVAGARAATLRCRALVDGDADGLCRAADVYRTTPHALELALTTEEAGAALALRGRRGEAVARLEDALALCQALGATRSQARIDASLRALGVRHRRPVPPRATEGWGSLTPTELRVARLAAEGLTNRQIGERLFVSGRTVGTHLAHAFRKLGVSTRAQLAAEAVRRGV